ncbi:MAG: Gfo/Idh/MocA family protein, partial [Pseudomonadota bacterium]
MSRLRLAVVGLGMALAPHARALAELADLYDVVGAYAPSPARRQAAARDFGLPVTDDLDRLIENVDVGLILTPPATHSELALRFFAAGRHVLLEKPLETDLERAKGLVAAAARHGRALGVVLQHRFREASLALEDLVTSGALGPLAVASCRVPWWRPQSYYDEPGRGTRARDGGGVLLTQAIHTLDLFRAVSGGVARVAAVARTTQLHRMECEDYVAATLELANGAVGWLEASTATYPGHPEEIRLVGTRGVATL